MEFQSLIVQEELLDPASLQFPAVYGVDPMLLAMEQQQHQQQQMHLQMQIQAQQQQLQMQMQQQPMENTMPDVVRMFIIKFHQSILSRNVQEIRIAYESEWSRLTAEFFSKTEWPEPELVSPLVNDDPIFLSLYSELYWRHVYSALQPDVEERYASYENYCCLFNYLLNSDGPVPIDLPDQWLWDILDEFVYQFQSFAAWRNKPGNKTDIEKDYLTTSGVWSSYSVLNVLYSLISKSKINEQLALSGNGTLLNPVEGADAYASKPLYRMLGYFALLSLLRVHVLLGDYSLALMSIQAVQLEQKNALFRRVTAAHVSTYYYVGICYIMLQRFSDASRTFTSILTFVDRTRKFHTRSYQYDALAKTTDKMYALLAIVLAIAPNRVEESIHTQIKERYNEDFAVMSRGGEESLTVFKELWSKSFPRFISANGPAYFDEELLQDYMGNPPPEPSQRHLQIFLKSIQSQLGNASIRSYLKLYSALDISKLASFTNSDEEDTAAALMVLKKNLNQVKWQEGNLFSGTASLTSDLNFSASSDMIQVTETKTSRKLGGWFLRQLNQQQDVMATIKSMQLPIAHSKMQQFQHNSNNREQSHGHQGQNRKQGGGGGNRVNWAPQVAAV